MGALLIGAILIQNPNDGSIDTTFGGNTSNQVFGAAKSTVLIEKITWYLGIMLFVFCVIATFLM